MHSFLHSQQHNIHRYQYILDVLKLRIFCISEYCCEDLIVEFSADIELDKVSGLAEGLSQCCCEGRIIEFPAEIVLDKVGGVVVVLECYCVGVIAQFPA